MVSSVRPVLGLAVAIIGFLGSIIICALPWWKFKAFVSINTEVIWEGLRVKCEVQSTNQVQCVMYGSLLNLPEELPTIRALIVIAIVVGVFGVVLGVVGGKFTTFIEDQKRKGKVAIAAGILFITAGLMVLISVCWTTYTINQKPNNPKLEIESGAGIYVGWFTAMMLFLGGGLMCSSCPPGARTSSV